MLLLVIHKYQLGQCYNLIIILITSLIYCWQNRCLTVFQQFCVLTWPSVFLTCIVIFFDFGYNLVKVFFTYQLALVIIRFMVFDAWYVNLKLTVELLLESLSGKISYGCCQLIMCWLWEDEMIFSKVLTWS